MPAKRKALSSCRTATVERKTKETEIRITLNIDGSGISKINTGVGFFDHMLDCFARHGQFDLSVSCKGDLNVDCHHTVEDTGIVLGTAIREALGDKCGIRRYGCFSLPMDEALVLCAVDMSGRSYLVFDPVFRAKKLGTMDTEMFKEFFRAVSSSAAMNLHLHEFYGENSHHVAEACFKAFARALDEATEIDPRIKGVLSTKEVL